MHAPRVNKLVRQVKAVDLRFPSLDDEAAFKASLEPEVLYLGFLGNVMCTVIWIVWIMQVSYREYVINDNPLQRVDTIRSYCYVCWLSGTAVCAATSVLISLRVWREWFLRWDWELLALCSFTYTLFVLALSNEWHAPLIFGQHPDKVWSHDARGVESIILLSNDLALTLVALYMPIRSCVLWFLPVFRGSKIKLSKHQLPNNYYIFIYIYIYLFVYKQINI